MIEPKRYMIFIPSDGSTYERMDDPRGDWIHDPDHKIDVSKFCESENEQAIKADAKFCGHAYCNLHGANVGCEEVDCPDRTA